MRPFYILVLAFSVAVNTSAAPVITAVINSGSWSTPATWDLNRKPVNGDIIVIPAGKTIILNSNETLNGVLIKVFGTLSLMGGGKLNLDNASRINVYTGATIIGQGSNDQIKIGNTHVFKGSWPPVIGPMYADNTTGGGFLPMSLPVIFADFNVILSNGSVHIIWATAVEINNNHFEVERSLDGLNWLSIAKVMAAGNSNTIKNYSYIDINNKSVISYYRIKQVDNDGRTTYTIVRSLRADSVSSVEIFAGASKNITIRFDKENTNVTVNLLNLNGQVILRQSFSNTAYISFSANNLNSGIYLVCVKYQDNKNEIKKIMLN